MRFHRPDSEELRDLCERYPMTPLRRYRRQYSAVLDRRLHTPRRYYQRPPSGLPLPYSRRFREDYERGASRYYSWDSPPHDCLALSSPAPAGKIIAYLLGRYDRHVMTISAISCRGRIVLLYDRDADRGGQTDFF